MKIFVALFGLAVLVATSSAGQAADGCGRGRYWNGYRCVPMHNNYGPYGPVYRGPAGYPRPYIDRYGVPRCTDLRFSVQDGVCKPYRGY
jgi:hypothetical protein